MTASPPEMIAPDNLQNSRPTAAGSPADPRWRFAPAAARLGSSAIRDLLKLTEQTDILSFAGGLPNPAAFPLAAIRDACAGILAADAAGALQYGPTEGFGPLREMIAERLTRAGAPTRPAQVLVTAGSQQALDLIGKAFLTRGDRLLAANPSYLGALQAFALGQPQLIDLADDWHNTTRPAFCYLTPTFANPDGATLDQAARQHLLQDLGTAGVPLIEDDPYRDLWIDAPPPATCHALAPERTLYLGSFSKVLAPGLRVGYIAGPQAVVERLTRLKQAADLHTPGLNQRIVAALIADGTLDTHLPTLRQLYRRQRDALMAALDRHLRPYADWSVPQGGMFAWLRLKDRRDASQLLAWALRRKVAFVPGAPFHFDGAGASTLRLAYSTLAAEAMDEGMCRLRSALEQSGSEDRC